MKTYSQFLQDRFALLCCGSTTAGVYADIGAGDPETISNTFLLQREHGWTGLLCDIEYEARLRSERGGVVFGDALAVDWSAELPAIARDGWIDFLSLDLEPPELTIEILLRLPLHRTRFRCACIEHDHYRNASGAKRVAIVNLIMEHYGYRRVWGLLAQVSESTESIYIEDWFVPVDSTVTEQDVREMIEQHNREPQ